MKKQKNKSKKAHFQTALGSVLAVAVLLTAAHAKDLATPSSAHVLGSSTTADQALLARQIEKPIDKSIGDLHHHSHADNNLIKNFNSFNGDNAVMNNARRSRGEINEERPISVRLIEMVLMVKLAYAYATS